MSVSIPRVLRGACLALLAVHGPLVAQDVELLGRIHGTRPPEGYYDLMARDPGAFQFQRALMRRGLALRELPRVQPRGRALETVFGPGLALEAAEGEERPPVTGTFRFPLLLGLFSDSPDPAEGYSRESVQAEFWDGPQSNPNAVGTIGDYYAEVSGGRIALTGATFDWKRSTLTRAQVTAGVSGLGNLARVADFIVELIKAADDGTVDWGQFDNDGPDGLPNSGDDDGYVDVLAVAHPTPGGECQSADRLNRIWSHRWNLYSAANPIYQQVWAPGVQEQLLANEGWVTEAPSANGGFIRVLDYTIQPVTNCAWARLNDIGVFVHELGHGFGLPDLYGVNASHAGIGNWGLMGTGSWGCNGSTPERPCHMSAWSKSVLGWVEVENLPPDTDLGTLALSPVETSGKVYRIESGDGSGEYLLLENRQRTAFDANLYEPGLLVWHIDPVTIAARWPTNTINSNGNRLGVWLRQADGLNSLALANGGRGDANDPFPGRTGNTAFHAGSTPGSWTHGGETMGVTLLDVAPVGLDVTFRALTRFTDLTLRAETVNGTPGLISVDGVARPGTESLFPSAPFRALTIAAAPGEPLAPGVRAGFKGWSDGGPRVRSFTTPLEDSTLTATFEGRQVQLEVSLLTPVPGISPGTVSFIPGDADGWVGEGETVVVAAVPRTGFSFVDWTGALAGLPNPAALTATAPLTAGALFALTFSAASNPASVSVQGGIPHTVALQVENANLPVTWTMISGTLPSGMTFGAQGILAGTPLEGGSYPLYLRVRDAIGLEGTVSMTLAVVDPEIPAQTVLSPFLLTEATLPESVKTFLDRTGNANGAYDLGDFRAFFLRNPDLSGAGELQAAIHLVVPLGEMRDRPAGSGGEARREDRP